MDFNIHEYVNKLKSKSQDSSLQRIVTIFNSMNIKISEKNLVNKKGILFIINTPLIQKSHVKINKKKIIEKLKDSSIEIYDIM
jgi:hypothetical protein